MFYSKLVCVCGIVGLQRILNRQCTSVQNNVGITNFSRLLLIQTAPECLGKGKKKKPKRGLRICNEELKNTFGINRKHICSIFGAEKMKTGITTRQHGMLQIYCVDKQNQNHGTSLSVELKMMHTDDKHLHIK